MDETAPVPLHLRNAPTKMMKDMKYGEGYLYNPGYRHAPYSVISVNTRTTSKPLRRHPVHQEYLPAGVAGQKILLEEGDMSGKIWDENALRNWEWRANGGDDWPGRTDQKVTTEGDKKGQDV